ncbi:PilN domain-containing protein [Lysobacter koreensis]|uniref:PilN domain-containing protein n=1 Tax=Lysobacter koreensis TaxID=266122 RepID=A0ABW2YL15_9GAMM
MTQIADSRLRDRFGRFGARLGGSSLGVGAGGFLSWWGHALASWLPLRVRQALGFDRGRVLLQIDRAPIPAEAMAAAPPAQGDGLQLRLQQGGELRDLGHAPGLADGSHDPITAPGDPLAALLGPRLTDLPRWLLLPAASGLRRRLPLPAAAAERLRDVVGFEIDRQTPFSADAVAFDARVLGRRDSDGQLDVELVAVPRSALDPQLAALGLLASTLAGVDVAATDGTPLGVNLLPLSQRRRHADPFRVWNWALAAVAVLAVAALLWQLLENRRQAAAAFERDIARRAQPARQAAAQRAELIGLIEGQAFLDRTRGARPTAVEVMDELSRRLPDGTYLEKLAIEAERLTLIGLSNEAPALIGRLDGSTLWRSPALAGALQPDPASGRDRFTLTAELTAVAPAATPARGVASPQARTPDQEAARAR